MHVEAIHLPRTAHIYILAKKESRFLPASFTVILFLAIIPLLFTYVFAQVSPLSGNDSKSLGPQGLLGTIQNKTSSTTTQLNSTSTNLPILTKTSDKGIYKVQLRWSSPPGIQSPNSLPKNGFTMEILFLNATAPEPTNNANQSAFSHNPDGSLRTDSVKFTAKVT